MVIYFSGCMGPNEWGMPGAAFGLPPCFITSSVMSRQFSFCNALLLCYALLQERKTAFHTGKAPSRSTIQKWTMLPPARTLRTGGNSGPMSNLCLTTVASDTSVSITSRASKRVRRGGAHFGALLVRSVSTWRSQACAGSWWVRSCQIAAMVRPPSLSGGSRMETFFA